MPEFGVAIDGRAAIADIPAQARAAEDGGASTLWIACHLFLRDPVTTAAIALSATARIKVCLMAMSPYSVHPVFTAMSAATLEEAFPGRVLLCLGVGAPADLQAAGIACPRPLATMKEAIGLCRALFKGELVDEEGEIFGRATRRLINGGRPVPIVLAASRPNMLALAGRVADGVLISAATSLPFLKASLERAQKDAASRVRSYGIVYTRISSSEREAIDGLRRLIGFVLRGAHHQENIRLSGAALDQAALAAAYAEENWAFVDRLISDDVVRLHAACGTPDQVGVRLAEYGAIGLDEVILGGIDDAKAIAVALAAAQAATRGAASGAA
jgi:5,10-methylenetetrahydromethanopterin reductase